MLPALQGLLPFLHNAGPAAALRLVSEPSWGHLITSCRDLHTEGFRERERAETKQGNSGLTEHGPAARGADRAVVWNERAHI